MTGSIDDVRSAGWTSSPPASMIRAAGERDAPCPPTVDFITAIRDDPAWAARIPREHLEAIAVRLAWAAARAHLFDEPKGSR